MRPATTGRDTRPHWLQAHKGTSAAGPGPPGLGRKVQAGYSALIDDILSLSKSGTFQDSAGKIKALSGHSIMMMKYVMRKRKDGSKFTRELPETTGRAAGTGTATGTEARPRARIPGAPGARYVPPFPHLNNKENNGTSLINGFEV